MNAPYVELLREWVPDETGQMSPADRERYAGVPDPADPFANLV